MASVGDVATTARESVGRYFSLVSALPSMLLVFYVFLLGASGAWSGRPDFQRAINAGLHLGVAGSLLLVASGIGVALVLHPLQFAMVQLLEGYWGIGWFAERARGLRMAYHWKRFERLLDRTEKAEDALEKVAGYHSTRQMLVRRMLLVSRIDESSRLQREYPADEAEVMPTRLGMVLRHYESSAGKPYGLNAIAVMPYLARVANAEDMAYVNDQRSQLDVAVRLNVTALLACLLTVCLLWRDGIWLLLALPPYAIAYLSYRGAIIAARQYGQAVAVVIALNRFALYERLRLPLPATSDSERKAADNLSKLLSFEESFTATYRHPN